MQQHREIALSVTHRRTVKTLKLPFDKPTNNALLRHSFEIIEHFQLESKRGFQQGNNELGDAFTQQKIGIMV